MGFKDRGIYLLTGFLLLGIILSLLGPFFLNPLFKFFLSDSAGEIILFISWLVLAFFSLIFPFMIILLISIIYYLKIGFKNKPANKIIFSSAIIYLVSVPVFISAAILSIVPCLRGPSDGLCMLFGLFLMIPELIIWSIAFIILFIGIILQYKQDKLIQRGR